MLNHQSILITGGTGSFGKAFVQTDSGALPEVKRLVIFSRDELKQFEMAQQFRRSNLSRPCATSSATSATRPPDAVRWKASTS